MSTTRISKTPTAASFWALAGLCTVLAGLCTVLAGLCTAPAGIALTLAANSPACLDGWGHSVGVGRQMKNALVIGEDGILRCVESEVEPTDGKVTLEEEESANEAEGWGEGSGEGRGEGEGKSRTGMWAFVIGEDGVARCQLIKGDWKPGDPVPPTDEDTADEAKVPAEADDAFEMIDAAAADLVPQ